MEILGYTKNLEKITSADAKIDPMGWDTKAAQLTDAGVELIEMRTEIAKEVLAEKLKKYQVN